MRYENKSILQHAWKATCFIVRWFIFYWLFSLIGVHTPIAVLLAFIAAFFIKIMSIEKTVN